MESSDKKDSNLGFGIAAGLVMSAMLLSLTACSKKNNAVKQGGSGMYYEDDGSVYTSNLIPYGKIMVDEACIPCPNIIDCFGPPE